MENERSDLDNALNELITKQVFSLEAVTRIKEIKDDIENLESISLEKESRIERLAKENKECNSVVDILQARVEELNDRLGNIEVREARITRLELIAEFSELRRADAMQLALSMTRNTVLRESFKTPVRSQYADGMGNVLDSQILQDDTATKEVE